MKHYAFYSQALANSIFLYSLRPNVIHYTYQYDHVDFLLDNFEKL